MGIGILAAALVSGAASATEITVGESRLVIDVEFWGRYRITSPPPGGGNEDVITFGDPVHGKFRIFPGDAPAPKNTSAFLDLQDAKVYGKETGSPPPSGAAFVTSRWLSPFPKSPLPVGITHQVSPSPDSAADDSVVIGDGVRFRPSEPKKDWFVVTDRFSPSSPVDTISGEALSIQVSSPLDFLDGLGLEQAFELNDLQETKGATTSGYFRAKVGDTAVAFHRFVVDRLRVTPRVCRP
jgi:hypothetical protein